MCPVPTDRWSLQGSCQCAEFREVYDVLGLCPPRLDGRFKRDRNLRTCCRSDRHCEVWAPRAGPEGKEVLAWNT